MVSWTSVHNQNEGVVPVYEFPQRVILVGDFVISNHSRKTDDAAITPEYLAACQPVKLTIRTSPGREAFVPMASPKHHDTALSENIIYALSGSFEPWSLHAVAVNGHGIRFQLVNTKTLVLEEFRTKSNCGPMELQMETVGLSGAKIQHRYTEKVEHEHRYRVLEQAVRSNGLLLPKKTMVLSPNHGIDHQTEILLTESF